ncbi:DNA-binding transcriptional regulator, AcrR family [Blastococcus sp. DSM 46786]|uniref:TetR/AcrR family transcriptional regulator n=1 Tax=Blastococcus sp. DSM 46786 TaxID=1798227 RepID=UPI0008C4080B|nr:TetR/AcrR family transcriptional regulator [Blastococcus sp. DSM 46786]SEL54425.1 DNA-binding transcriptional regulator, AcrR family [Blastococcus sp. DSM 46786]
MTDAARPSLRADAARNRDAIVAAARTVFAEHGLGASLDEIARRAGVGNATLYRRFPSREELVQAALLPSMTDYLAAVDEGLADPDPWAGFRDYLLRLFQLQARDRGLADLLVTTVRTPSGELEELRSRAFELTKQLIRRAQDADELRPDFRHQDLPLLLMANAGLVERTQKGAPDSWRRVAAFLLDGLQTRAATPAPPAPTERSVLRVMAANRLSSRHAEQRDS